MHTRACYSLCSQDIKRQSLVTIWFFKKLLLIIVFALLWYPVQHKRCKNQSPRVWKKGGFTRLATLAFKREFLWLKRNPHSWIPPFSHLKHLHLMLPQAPPINQSFTLLARAGRQVRFTSSISLSVLLYLFQNKFMWNPVIPGAGNSTDNITWSGRHKKGIATSIRTSAVIDIYWVSFAIHL